MPKLMLTLLLLVLANPSALAAADTQCPPESGIALQVLGSGGPIADDGRASSAYLVWIDGKARVLIDAGGGSFLRFGEAGARFEDLDLIGLSHFHTDHSTDFVALLKSGYFSGRKRELVVAGPSGDGAFPGLVDYLDRLVGPADGAYAYLSGYLDGSGGLAQLVPVEVEGDGYVDVYGAKGSDVHIEAMHVPHGIVPTLAFGVQVGKKRIVFSSDQNGSSIDFVSFIVWPQVLVMHMVIPEDATGVATRLHMKPSTISYIARKTMPDHLVVSHLMARSLGELERNVRIASAGYDGNTVVAEDLLCLPF